MKVSAGWGRLSLLALLLALGGWVSQADPLALFGRLSWLTYDSALQWLRPSPATDPRIVIVDLDDTSLQAQGRWPWPRQRLAELIDAIQRAEPTHVGLDILLPDASTPGGDAELAERLAVPNLTVATGLGGIDERATTQGWPSARRELAPADSLRTIDGRYPALGHISPQLADDGRIRWLYPRLCGPQECRSILALAMLERVVGLDAEQYGQGGDRRLCVGGFCQWIDYRGRLLVPFHHPSRFTYLSADDVMQGLYQDRLSGALVLVGTSASGLGDLVATPRDALTPGVELHAILLAAWLDSQAWRPLPHTRFWLLAGLLSVVLVSGYALGKRRTDKVQRYMILTMLLLAVLPPVLMMRGYWLDPWPWWLAGLGVLLLWLGVERLRLWQRHRRLYRAFGAYVPHGVLRQLAQEKSDTARDTAQRRPLVIMFTDIRGFTALSETLTPERLTTLTNHIFSELTEVVHQHGGTLDKYIGDALMAFWGAPLACPDDPERALACALAIQQRLFGINAWCRQHGFPDIAMNIGLEAGEVTVGNLGSRQRRAYTAMGQAVNLAARLEELAAGLSQPILAGPGLAAAMHDEQRLAPLMEVEIRGLSQPVTVSIPAVTADARVPPQADSVSSVSDT